MLKQDIMNMAPEILREAAMEEGSLGEGHEGGVRAPNETATGTSERREPRRIRLPASAVRVTVKPPVLLPPLLHAPQVSLTPFSVGNQACPLPGQVECPPPFADEFRRAQAARESFLQLKLAGVAVEPVFKNPENETWQRHPAAGNWGQGWEVSYQHRPRVANKNGPAIRVNH